MAPKLKCCMAQVPNPKRLREIGVRRGPHALCYRCDWFADESTGECPICHQSDRVAPCVFEWCSRCQEKQS
jgi:hypothetical protein